MVLIRAPPWRPARAPVRTAACRKVELQQWSSAPVLLLEQQLKAAGLQELQATVHVHQILLDLLVLQPQPPAGARPWRMTGQIRSDACRPQRTSLDHMADVSDRRERSEDSWPPLARPTLLCLLLYALSYDACFASLGGAWR